jgi:hypothetical protein
MNTYNFTRHPSASAISGKKPNGNWAVKCRLTDLNKYILFVYGHTYAARTCAEIKKLGCDWITIFFGSKKSAALAAANIQKCCGYYRGKLKKDVDIFGVVKII